VIGGVLYRYFFLRQIRMIGMVLGGIVIIAYMADFTEFARRAGGWPEYTFARGLYLSAMRMPMIIMLVWPFVALFASMGVLISLNRRYELVIARSAGLSAWQFLSPLCLASFSVGLFAILVVNPLAAYSLSTVQELEGTFRGYRKEVSDQLEVPWLRQRTDDGATVIGAGSSARRGAVLGDAVFLQFDADGNFTERFDARSATLETGAWRLENVTRTDLNGNREQLDTYRIESALQPEYVEQRLSDPQEIPIYELPQKIDISRALGISGNRIAMHFHSLVALPMLLVAMTLIAATVCLRFARMGQSGTMIVGGILAGFLLYVTLVVVTAFGNVGLVPPMIAAWVPVIVAMFCGVTFLLYKEDG